MSNKRDEAVPALNVYMLLWPDFAGQMTSDRGTLVRAHDSDAAVRRAGAFFGNPGDPLIVLELSSSASSAIDEFDVDRALSAVEIARYRGQTVEERRGIRP